MRTVEVGGAVFTYWDLERANEASDIRVVFLRFVAPGHEVVGLGALSVLEISREFGFSDYVEAGLEINVMVGIDMTRSNGDPRAPGSLHAFTEEGVPGPSNEYVRVIESVMGIMSHYDSDQKYPVFGFGAKIPPFHTRVSQCFALNGDFFHPEVNGVSGILEAYRNALGVVIPHGPTQLGELLRVAAEWAAALEGQARYLVLLVITDGAMEGFHATVAQIIAMARLPISIVFVGVGDADFSRMVALDADHKPLTNEITGEKAERDIVQFVPFREFSSSDDLDKLAAACLAEIPREIVGYFGSRNIFPNHVGRGFTGVSTEVVEDEDGEGRQTPRFLDQQRTELLVTIHNQGYEEELVERTVKTTGVLCPDPLHAIDIMFHLRKRRRGHVPVISDSGQIAIADRLNVPDLLQPKSSSSASASASNNGKENFSIVVHSRRPASSNAAGLCRVCFTHSIDVQLRPCGHKIVCGDCSTKIGRLCPLCRATVDSTSQLAVNS